MRIHLAPMEGVVDHHLRYLLSRMGGIDICVTEFVRVTEHTLPRKVFYRYSPELLVRKSQNNSHLTSVRHTTPLAKGPLQEEPSMQGALCPTKVQLLGSNSGKLASNARKAANLGAPGIDLNFGCPAKTVNKSRGGACLLKEPNTIYRIVSSVRKSVPAHIPVSAKIRLGYDLRDSYLDNATAIRDAGADELIVHARSKSDGYKPPAYWECIAEIREKIDLNVVANGEIWTLEDYRRCRDITGCQDFMLGRGLLATPDLARQIKSEWGGQAYRSKHWYDIAHILLEFLDITTRVYAAKYTGNRVKQWLFYLSRGYPEAAKLFEQIKRVRQYDVLRSSILKSAENDHA